jgi:capping protein alpha
MMSSDDRVQVATSFILQSPPGEINDVLNGAHHLSCFLFHAMLIDTLPLCADVRVIVDDDAGLEEGVLPALREYNLAQFTTVDVPGGHHQVSS